MAYSDIWQCTLEDLDEIIEANPSLRGMVFGYLAEHRLRKMCFSDNNIFSKQEKPDDHNRKKKGDLTVIYKDTQIIVESKSLQTNSIKKVGNETFKTRIEYQGYAQCDASDKRKLKFSNGQELPTTCLLTGEFDLLAVNIFGFGNQWRFAFAKNKDLPLSTSYPDYPQELLATTVDLTWPLSAPFTDNLFQILDEIVEEKKAGTSPEIPKDVVAIEPVEKKTKKSQKELEDEVIVKSKKKRSSSSKPTNS